MGLCRVIALKWPDFHKWKARVRARQESEARRCQSRCYRRAVFAVVANQKHGEWSVEMILPLVHQKWSQRMLLVVCLGFNECIGCVGGT